MSRRSDGRSGLSILIVFLVAYLLALWGRETLPHQGPPAFSVAGPSGIWIEVGDEFASPGVHQIFDVSGLRDVTKLTNPGKHPQNSENLVSYRTLEPGEYFSFGSESRQNSGLKRSWMSAGKRIALGIPLHPDRMTVADWQYFSGIGPVLALRIEENRQKYGDFGSIGNLSRVRGIGPKRLANMTDFFGRRKSF